jgi:DnaJ-domain-containing protein 1
VTDLFAVLDESRRPWLDGAALKQKFLSRSAELHPDRTHSATGTGPRTAQECFTELNAAYQCLSEPRLRLRHLLELELGQKPSDLTEIPDEQMNLFFELGQAFRAAEALRAEKARAASPLLQVQIFTRCQDLVETLHALRDRVTALREAELEKLRAIDLTWPPAPPRPVESLLQIWRQLSFCDRWLAQIQQQVVELSL